MTLELQFSSLGEFLQMGDYTFHVWSVYALFLFFLAYNLYMPILQRRRFMRQQRARARRRRNAAGNRRANPEENGMAEHSAH